MRWPHPEVSEGSVVQRQLGDAAPVSVGQGLWGAVASAQRVLLRQQPLQLRRRSARHQRPDQSQNIIVEVRLRETRAKKMF